MHMFHGQLKADGKPFELNASTRHARMYICMQEQVNKHVVNIVPLVKAQKY